MDAALDRLRIVKEDLVTVVLNLNALQEGGASGFQVSMLDLGTLQIPGPADGSEFWTFDMPADPIEWAMRLKARRADKDYMELRSMFRDLGLALKDGNWIELRERAGEPSIFFKFRPLMIPSLLRGQVTMWSVLDQGSDEMESETLDLLREPFLREAPVELLEAGAMTNEVGMFAAKVFNPGTMPSPAKLTVVVPDVAAEGVQLRVATKPHDSEAIADAHLALYSVEAEDGTVGTNTANEIDANASGGNFTRTTYAAVGYSRERVEVIVVPPTANAKAALEGEHDVYAIVRITEASEQTLGLKSGLRSVNPLDNTHDPVTLDAKDANSEMWVPVRLGRIEYTTNADELVWQLWAQLDEQPGAAVLDVDYFVLMPIGTKVITAGVMGWRAGRAAVERYRGDELVTPTSPAGLTAGTVKESGVVLDANDEAVGTQPNAGTPYPAGRLVVTARVTVKDQSGDRNELGVLRLRNITDGTTDVSRKIYSKKNRKEWETEVEIALSTNAAKLYQAQVEATNIDPDASQKIVVEELRTRFVRVVGDGDSFVLDADEPKNDGVWADGVKVAHLPAITHLTLEPGWSTVLIQMGEWSGLAYHSDVDEREPLAKIVQERDFEATLEVTPMHPA
jgi:hypothetical protein